MTYKTSEAAAKAIEKVVNISDPIEDGESVSVLNKDWRLSQNISMSIFSLDEWRTGF